MAGNLITYISILCISSFACFSQEFRFSINHKIPVTPVKDQNKTNVCWGYAALSMIEAELLRTSGKVYDLSEMFLVYKTFEEKAVKYIRMHGKINFGGGGALNDVSDMMGIYGIVPESAYTGLKEGQTTHDHTEMEMSLTDYLNAYTGNEKTELPSNLFAGFNTLLNYYLGEIPDSFMVDSHLYNSNSYMDELPIDITDYVLITSFSHHPYYEPFILEIPDNWSWGDAYNIPLEELLELTDSALLHNYSIAWALDISEKGYSWRRGVAYVPEDNPANLPDSLRQIMDKLPEKQREKMIYSFSPFQEKNISQEVRQKAFDLYNTTDDHGMHIMGIAYDQNGNKFYYAKNSWGRNNAYNGFVYISEKYYAYKTLSILLNKNGIPGHIRDKLGI